MLIAGAYLDGTMGDDFWQFPLRSQRDRPALNDTHALLKAGNLGHGRCRPVSRLARRIALRQLSNPCGHVRSQQRDPRWAGFVAQEPVSPRHMKRFRQRHATVLLFLVRRA